MCDVVIIVEDDQRNVEALYVKPAEIFRVYADPRFQSRQKEIENGTATDRLLENMTSAGDAAHNAPFLKQLADSSLKTRTTAFENLRLYLRAHTHFTALDLLKLWKGLFYCMWMQDRPKAQQRLAVDLAGLVDVLRDENAMGFLRAFWETMAREWNGIDVLRMDKFLYLVRQNLAASFRFLSRHSWSNAAAVQQCMVTLSDIPLNTSDARIPNGLRYHVLDIYVDELDMVDSERKGDMPLETLLVPVRRMEKESVTKALRKRAKETLEDERLRDWNGNGDMGAQQVVGGQDQDSIGVEIEEDEEWGGIED